MFSIRPLLLAILWLALPAAQAQPDLPTTVPSIPINNVGDSLATLNIKYCSVFENYTSFKDQDVDEWRKTNDAVHQAGGWRAYAREARRPEPARTKLAAAPCPPGLLPNLPNLPNLSSGVSSDTSLENKP